MSSLYSVNATCLRYIVPFQYKESFEEAYQKVENQKEEKLKKDKQTGEKKPTGEFRNDWTRRSASTAGAESDLYEYIKNEFRFDNETDDLAEQKAGCEWLFWRSDESETKDGKKIKELLYYPEGISKKDTVLPEGWNLTFKNVGLMLFRNGLGFVWYEIALPKEGMNSNHLKQFQNNIRELNRSERTLLWEKSKSVPDQGFVFSEKKDYKRYMSPFSIAKWLQDLLSFLDISYFAERKSSYANMIKKSMENIEGLSCEKIYTENQYSVDDMTAPDKAILFTYASFETIDSNDSMRDRFTLAYHLTNGYKNTYHYSDDVTAKMKRPFDDAIWYATQEGVSYLAWPGDDNTEVFNSLIPAKIRTDYFTLYLKTLYQSFSLLIYAEKIQAEISAVNGKYLTEPLDKRITELFGEINLFLTKSMATSVSHIHHQSEFYVYLKEQLRVHDDVKSVTSGLNALDVLQREQRQREENKRMADAWQAEQRRDYEAQKEREAREAREKKSDGKIQAIMGLFAMLGISSALIDCFDFIAKFSSGGEWNDFSSGIQCVEIIFMVIIGSISMIAIVFAVKAIIDAFRDKDN